MKSTIILYSLLFLTHAHAFTFNTSSGASFQDDTIQIEVADHTCQHLGVTPDDLVEMLQEATHQYWNKAPTSRLKLSVSGLVTKSQAFYDESLCLSSGASGCRPNGQLISERHIVVSCNQNMINFPGTAILAVSAPNNVQGQRILSALILLNDRVGSRFAERERDEQVAILAHELGHAIGLGHSPVIDSLMFYRTIPTRRSLGQDDIDGITYLYPHQIDTSACGTILLDNDRMTGLGRTLMSLFFIVFFLILGTKKMFQAQDSGPHNPQAI